MVAKFELQCFFLLEIYLNCPQKNRQIFHIKIINIINIILKTAGNLVPGPVLETFQFRFLGNETGS